MTKGNVFLLALTMVFLALAAASPAYAAPGCAPLNLSINPTNVEEFQPLTITNSVTNCSSSAHVVTVNVNLTANGTCGIHSESFSFKVLLRAQKSRSLSFMLPVPPCDGTYTVTETSKIGSTVTGSATTSLKVN